MFITYLGDIEVVIACILAFVALHLYIRAWRQQVLAFVFALKNQPCRCLTLSLVQAAFGRSIRPFAILHLGIQKDCEITIHDHSRFFQSSRFLLVLALDF